MKQVFIFIWLFPLWVSAQTVHLHDKKVEYKDDVKLQGLSETEIFNRAKEALKNVVRPIVDMSIDKDRKELKTEGVIRVSTSYPIVQNVHYTLKLSVKDGGYRYKIDDVSLWERHRGDDKGRLISSKDLVDQLDDTGKPAIEAEHILNAIDLNLQKVLTLIETKMKG
jgi:hypothetical protein